MYRKVEAKAGKCRTVRRPRRGSPQGGVLSPTIWNIIMDELLCTFPSGGMKAVGYADDVILMVKGKDPYTMANLMNRCLGKVATWGHKNGLLFNPAKTVATLFSKGRTRYNINLKMDNTRLELSDQMKYLGITLTRTLNWATHIKERVRKAIATMQVAKSIVGQKWGLTPSKVYWVYSAMARPVITYGSIVWAHKISPIMKKHLDRVQRLALLAITSSMRSTPTTGMEVVLGLLPLDLHAQAEAVKARLRTRAMLKASWDGLGNQKNPTKGHQRALDDKLETICPKGFPLDAQPKKLNWSTQDKFPDPDYIIYTDGSKMETGAGSGWTLTKGDTVIQEECDHLGKEATVFQAEVVAINNCLRWVKNNIKNNTSLRIFSDSQSAIAAIACHVINSRLVEDCCNIIKDLQSLSYKVAIHWVKGHSDNTGNELADFLAKQGSESKSMGPEPWIPKSLASVKVKIKENFLNTWQRRWSNDVKCNQTKAFFPRPEYKISKLVTRTRKELNLLVQAGTGHALVGYHVGKWVNSVQKQCLLCNETEETTMHLFRECPALELLRRQWDSLEGTYEWKLLWYFKQPGVQDVLERRSEAIQQSNAINS